MNTNYYPPTHKSSSFHCPLCNVYAKQEWGKIAITGSYSSDSWLVSVKTFYDNPSEDVLSASRCTHCGRILIWSKDNIAIPKVKTVPVPNDDLTDEIKTDYLEAANIITDSPRAAAALLRLALQKLCISLGEKGQNINDDIKNMVQKGLNPLIQKSFDAIRITGNNAVHPGEIDLTENNTQVYKLFELINFIAQKMITEPKEIESFYNSLPDNALKAIDKRDHE